MADPVQQGIVDAFKDVLDFALETLSDPVVAQTTFGVLIDPQPIQEAREKLEGLRAFQDDGESIPESLIKLGDAAARIVEISQLIEVSAQGGPGEMAKTLLPAAAIAYLEEHAPVLMAVARLLSFVDDQIHFDRLWSFLGDVGSYLEDNNFGLGIDGPDTEEDARRQSLLLGLVAIGFMALQRKGRGTSGFELDRGAADFEVLHGWEPTVGLDTPRADAVSERMLSVALRLGRLGAAETDAVALFCTVALVPAEHGGPGMWWTFAAEREIEAPIGDDGWHIVVDASIADGVDCFWGFGPVDSFVRFGSLANTEAEVRYERRDESKPGVATQPWRLPGFEVRQASFALRLAAAGPFLTLRLRDAAFVLEPDAGGWLGGLLPGGARVDFDLGIGLTRDFELVFDGANGLRAQIPVSRHIRALHIQTVLAELRPGPDDRVDLELSAGLSLHIGDDATVVAEGLGLALRWDGAREPRKRFTVDELLPSRLGVAIDTELVKGGGFLFHDRERRQYGGMLELRIKKLSLKAFGLLTEREDGGYSFIVVLSLDRESPPLGMGLRVTGIGGILGLHHRLDAAALQAAIRAGGAGDLLFPKDPVANAPRILATLGAVFPPAAGHYVFGPMLKLAWGTDELCELSFAIVLEKPSPRRLLILGKLDVTAPHKKLPLLLLHAEFAGIIDFDRPSFEFDASITGSRVGPYPLTGDICVRVAGGDQPQMLLTAGGFHPRFPVPAELNLPKLRRITVALSSGDNPRARLELYTAIVPGSWQIGGKLELKASAGGFSAEALVSVDAIFGEIRIEGEETRSGIQFDLEARAAIRYGGSTIAGVDVRLSVVGIEPWTINGRAKLSLFLFSITIPIRGTFGNPVAQVVLPLVDAAAMLLTALNDAASWETGLPARGGPLVTLAGRASGDNASAAHPLGRLALRQFALPLEIELTRVGGARAAPDRFEIASVRVAGGSATKPPVLRSPFAAGQYLDLSDDEKLSRPAFEPMVAGFEVGGQGATFAPAETANLTYEEIVIGPDGPLGEPRPGRPGLRAVFAHATSLGAAAVSPVRRDDAGERLRDRTGAGAISVNDVAPALVDASTLRPAAVPGLDGARTHTEVAQALARHVAAGRAAAGDLALVGAHEVAGA